MGADSLTAVGLEAAVAAGLAAGAWVGTGVGVAAGAQAPRIRDAKSIKAIVKYNLLTFTTTSLLDFEFVV
jgi:hypothetical protein